MKKDQRYSDLDFGFWSTITAAGYALGIVSVLLFAWFFPVDFSLPSDSVPLIGEASKYNVDVSGRVGLFYKVILSGVALYIFFFWLFKQIYRLFFQSSISFFNGWYFVAPSIALVFMGVLGAPVNQLLLLTVGLFVLQLLFDIRNVLSRGNASDNTFSFAYVMAISAVFFTVIQMLFAHVIWVENYGITLFFTIAFSLLGLLYYFPKFTSLVNANWFILWIALIPFLVFISIEVEFFHLEKWKTNLGYKKVFVGLLLLLAGILFVIFNSFSKYLPKFRANVLVRYCLAPSVIFLIVLLEFYSPMTLAKDELFELANPANALMRFSQFGEIPFLDFMSSHLLYEQWYGYLYQFVFGFDGTLAFTIYEFFNHFLHYLIVYAVFIRLGIKPLVTVWLLFVFPIVAHIFFVPVFPAFLILLWFSKVWEDFTASNVFKLLLLLFGLLLWRLDAGVVALFVTLVFTPILIFIAFSSKNRRSFAQSFKPIIIGGAYFVLLLLVMGLIAIYFRPFDYLWQHFLAALHYVKGSQAHGYASLFDGTYHQFYIYHVFFVFATVIVLLYSVWILKTQHKNQLFSEGKWLVFAIFALLIFLLNAQRGLVRHGFAESNELFFVSTFYFGMSLFVIHFIRKKPSAVVFSCCYLVPFMFFITTKYFPFLPKELPANSAIQMSLFQRLPEQTNRNNYQGRVEGQEVLAGTTYKSLKLLFDKNMTPDQSFIDFSNTPMRYYYCKRRVPGYFNQNLQNTIDEFLQIQLINAFKMHDLPFVIYAASPKSWFDATDGIANQLRYYLVAEYIHENYLPLGVLSGMEIWVRKGFELKEANLSVPEIGLNENINLGFLAGWEGNRFLQQRKNRIFENLEVFPLDVYDTTNTLGITIASKWRQENGVMLLLKVHPDAPLYLNEQHSSVELKHPIKDEKLTFEFKRDDSQFKYYMIRLSNHYFWHQNGSLLVTFPGMLGIENVTLIKEKQIEN